MTYPSTPEFLAWWRYGGLVRQHEWEFTVDPDAPNQLDDMAVDPTP